METQAIETLGTGALFMGSIILGLGPQNLHVLRCGLENNRTRSVVLICAFGDVFIILLGTYSLGYITSLLPSIGNYLHYAGFLVLSFYALCSLVQVRKQTGITDLNKKNRAIHSALLLTFCNPCVYLDSFFLIGQQANLYSLEVRWFYAAGAALTSTLWYASLGFGASILKNVFNTKSSGIFFNIFTSIILAFAALNCLFK